MATTPTTPLGDIKQDKLVVSNRLFNNYNKGITPLSEHDVTGSLTAFYDTWSTKVFLLSDGFFAGKNDLYNMSVIVTVNKVAVHSLLVRSKERVIEWLDAFTTVIWQIHNEVKLNFDIEKLANKPYELVEPVYLKHKAKLEHILTTCDPTAKSEVVKATALLIQLPFLAKLHINHQAYHEPKAYIIPRIVDPTFDDIATDVQLLSIDAGRTTFDPPALDFANVNHVVSTIDAWLYGTKTQTGLATALLKSIDSVSWLRQAVRALALYLTTDNRTAMTVEVAAHFPERIALLIKNNIQFLTWAQRLPVTPSISEFSLTTNHLIEEQLVQFLSIKPTEDLQLFGCRFVVEPISKDHSKILEYSYPMAHLDYPLKQMSWYQNQQISIENVNRIRIYEEKRVTLTGGSTGHFIPLETTSPYIDESDLPYLKDLDNKLTSINGLFDPVNLFKAAVTRLHQADKVKYKAYSLGLHVDVEFPLWRIACGLPVGGYTVKMMITRPSDDPALKHCDHFRFLVRFEFSVAQKSGINAIPLRSILNSRKRLSTDDIQEARNELSGVTSKDDIILYSPSEFLALMCPETKTDIVVKKDWYLSLPQEPDRLTCEADIFKTPLLYKGYDIAGTPMAADVQRTVSRILAKPPTSRLFKGVSEIHVLDLNPINHIPECVMYMQNIYQIMMLDDVSTMYANSFDAILGHHDEGVRIRADRHHALVADIMSTVTKDDIFMVFSHYSRVYHNVGPVDLGQSVVDHLRAYCAAFVSMVLWDKSIFERLFGWGLGLEDRRREADYFKFYDKQGVAVMSPVPDDRLIQGL